MDKKVFLKSFSAELLALFFLVLGFIFVFLLRVSVSKADTGFIDPNGNGTQKGVGSFNCYSYFECIDDGIRQPSIPNVSDYLTISINNSGFYQMTSLSGAALASKIDIWIYHSESRNSLGLDVELWDETEKIQYGNTVGLPIRASGQWDSAVFSQLNLSQVQLDGLKIKLIGSRRTGGQAGVVSVFSLYGAVDFSQGGYRLSGEYISSAFNGGSLVSFASIEWKWSKTNPACSSCNIKLQIQTALDVGGVPGPWTSTWSGPEGNDGDETDYYTISTGQLIHKVHNKNQWFRYKAVLEGDGVDSPILEEVKIYYK